MELVDIIIIALSLVGFYLGWREGLIASLLRLIGSILVFVIAYMLKTPISLALMESCPFISFGGVFEGVTSLNIMLYEGISFVLCIIVLSIILKVLIKVSGVFNDAFNTNFITGMPNKIAGGLLGFVRFFTIAFFITFIASIIPQSTNYVYSSNLGPVILDKTPILSGMVKDLNKSFQDINDMFNNLTSENNQKEVNKETLGILIKYNIVSAETVQELVEQGKLDLGTNEEDTIED